MKKSIGVGALVVAMATFWIGRGHSETPPSLRDFMRVKLSHSQKVLEGLTTPDFDMIAKNSEALKRLSLESDWQVIQTPEYQDFSKHFRRAADALTETAKKKNLDGAALAYVELTMNCINCHKYVRGVRMATR
jgi:cytochrome c556